MARIHDKFVIELREVIKGYSNDYTVEDPFNLPCDYKFYEIDGVAICEESFKKMKLLTDVKREFVNDAVSELELYKDSFLRAERRYAASIVDNCISIIKMHTEDKYEDR